MQAADVALSCITLPCPLLWVHREAGAEGEPFGHKQGLRPPPSEFYVCFSVLNTEKNHEQNKESPAEEGGGGGISPLAGPSSFFSSLFPPFNFYLLKCGYHTMVMEEL